MGPFYSLTALNMTEPHAGLRVDNQHASLAQQLQQTAATVMPRLTSLICLSALQHACISFCSSCPTCVQACCVLGCPYLQSKNCNHHPDGSMLNSTHYIQVSVMSNDSSICMQNGCIYILKDCQVGIYVPHSVMTLSKTAGSVSLLVPQAYTD